MDQNPPPTAESLEIPRGTMNSILKQASSKE